MEATGEKTKVETAEENGEVWWDTDLDEEEQWYEDHFEEFVPCKNQEEMRHQLMEAAKLPPVIHYADGTTSETFRINTADRERIGQLAAEQGLQFQSLVGSILHRYAAGTLVDITEAKKILAVR